MDYVTTKKANDTIVLTINTACEFFGLDANIPAELESLWGRQLYFDGIAVTLNDINHFDDSIELISTFGIDFEELYS